MSLHTIAITNNDTLQLQTLSTVSTSQNYAKVYVSNQNFTIAIRDLLDSSNSLLYTDEHYLPESYQTMIASEQVLARDWNEPNEDATWANL
jgi:hypothetical protein